MKRAKPITVEVPRRHRAHELCGIVLHPAGHTRSPAHAQRRFAAASGSTPPTWPSTSVPEGSRTHWRVRALGVRQLAVSIPHKVAVMAHLDEVEDLRRCVSAPSIR